jgi:hypothetical protein
MKRMLLALSLGLLVSVSLSVGAAGASHSNGGGPKKNLVSGTGKNPTPSGVNIHLHVNAQSGPEGQNSRGHFALRSFFLDARGEVVCLAVRGNRAAFAGIVERNKTEVPLNQVLIWVLDTGEGKGPTDRFTFLGNAAPAPPPPSEEECRRLGEELLLAAFPRPEDRATQGNFTVHDATP